MACLLAGLTLYMLPASGPAVYLDWNRSVDAQTRTRLEREMSLHEPTHIGDMMWGYVLTDTSPGNVSRLLALPEAASRVGIDPDPARVSGKPIIRLAGPFAVQSFIGFLVGGLLILGASASDPRIRQMYFLVAVALLAVSWSTARLPQYASHTVSNWMGDYETFTEDRGHFGAYFGHEDVRFQYHLGGFVVNLLDRALGSTEESPRRAFVILPWIAGAIALLQLGIVAALARWSPQSMRYAALCIATPFALMFFGYKELGYLSVSVAAFPLLFMALADTNHRAPRLLCAAAALQGLHAALHGFGLVAVASALTMAVVCARSARQAIARFASTFTWASTAYLIWVPFYVIVLGRAVVPGHATGFALRPVGPSYVAEGRRVDSLLSWPGFLEVGMEALIAGMPVVLLALAAAQRGAERRALMAGGLVSGVLMVLLWPAQGIGQDADFVVSVFPALFAALWLCARHPRLTVVALGILGIGHAAFWYVVRSATFTHAAVAAAAGAN